MTSGKTRLTGLLGWPVSHSKSPRLHGAWLLRHNIDGVFLPLKVAPDHLADVVKALPLMGFVGANVTVPHKAAIIPLLDAIDPLALRIGAVNLLVIDSSGKITGRNTDALGFLLNLQDAKPDFRAERGPIALLGAGGAARAAASALLEAGATEIRLINRSVDKARQLALDLGPALIAVPWSERHEALEGAVLLVNSTSLGMDGQPDLEINLDRLPIDALVNDLVYAPLETKLLSVARHRGNPVADGLGMLLHQARPAFAAWWGIMPEITADLRRMMAEP